MMSLALVLSSTSVLSCCCTADESLVEACCAVQNPVTSLAWLVAIFELLGPLVSLVIDTHNFCQPALQYKPIMFMALLYLTMDYVAALGNPKHWGNIFAQYDFAKSYKRTFALTITVEAVCYGILTYSLRNLLQLYKRRRCMPA